MTKLPKNRIENRFYEGERPLYALQDTRLENVRFYPGESAIKESRNVEAVRCEFMGKYPFWHNENTRIEHCEFTIYSRAAIWYGKNIRMSDSKVDAPKMFREIDGLHLERVQIQNAAECTWNCRNIEWTDVNVKGGDYIFMNGKNIVIDRLNLQGNYSFQDAKNVVIRNSVLNSKDAFWNTENVTVYDSVIVGEYLGWHSKNLRLVNCRIGGTQPLCYASNLVLENCEMMDDADLAFEYSTLQATVNGHVVSIKNPMGGSIQVESVGEIILDEHCRNRGDCQISVVNKATA